MACDCTELQRWQGLQHWLLHDGSRSQPAVQSSPPITDTAPLHRRRFLRPVKLSPSISFSLVPVLGTALFFIMPASVIAFLGGSSRSAQNTVFAVLVGARWGSFANVCIHRLPLGQSVVRPGSRCPSCSQPIAWFGSISHLASFLLLRGRCRATCCWRRFLGDIR